MKDRLKKKLKTNNFNNHVSRLQYVKELYAFYQKKINFKRNNLENTFVIPVRPASAGRASWLNFLPPRHTKFNTKELKGI